MPRDLVNYPEQDAEVDPDGAVLLRAAAMIKRRGHYPGGTIKGANGEVCIGCAISYAKNGEDTVGWDMVYLAHIAPRLGFKTSGEIAEWNFGRTKAQVLSRLRHAAQVRG